MSAHGKDYKQDVLMKHFVDFELLKNFIYYKFTS